MEPAAEAWWRPGPISAFPARGTHWNSQTTGFDRGAARVWSSPARRGVVGGCRRSRRKTAWVRARSAAISNNIWGCWALAVASAQQLATSTRAAVESWRSGPWPLLVAWEAIVRQRGWPTP